MTIPEGLWKAEFDRKETVRRCRVLAHQMYGNPEYREEWRP